MNSWQPVEVGVAQQGPPAGQPPQVAPEGRPMTKEEQGQFMRRKAAEKAADMRRNEVLLLETRHVVYHIDVVGKGQFMRGRLRGRPPRCGATRFGPTKCI